jgi:hypothetical protein
MSRSLSWSILGFLVLLVSIGFAIRGTKPVEKADEAPGKTTTPNQRDLPPLAAQDAAAGPNETKAARRPAPPKANNRENEFWHGLPPLEMSAYIREQFARQPRENHLQLVRKFYRSDLAPAMRIELICNLEEGELSFEEVDFLRKLLKADPDRDVRESILLLATFHDPPAMQLLRDGRLDRDPEVRDLAVKLMEQYDSKQGS